MVTVESTAKHEGNRRRQNAPLAYTRFFAHKRSGGASAAAPRPVRPEFGEREIREFYRLCLLTVDERRAYCDEREGLHDEDSDAAEEVYRERIRRTTTSMEFGGSEWQPSARARGRVAMSAVGPTQSSSSSTPPNAQSASVGAAMRYAITQVEA